MGTALSEVLRKAGSREHLPSRIDEHVLSDAAEALVAYAWLHDPLTLGDSVETLGKTDSLVEGLTQLLLKVKERLKLSELFPVPSQKLRSLRGLSLPPSARLPQVF
jgi:hypothetical protein